MGVVSAAFVIAVPDESVDGKSVAAMARNAGAVAVAKSAWVVVVLAAMVDGAALAPPPIITPYWVRSADADSLVVVSYQGIAPATPAVLAAFIV